MNSLILISKNQNNQQDYLNNFIKTHNISPFDITKVQENKAIGIESVRKLQDRIFLAPFKGKEKIVVFYSAENITIEAQNALLKILEEPPKNTYIFLNSTTEEIFLPTVLSRCKVIKLTSAEPISNYDLDKTIEENFQTITNGSIADKFALAETLSLDKENLPSWFENITKLIRQKMLENIESKQSIIYANFLNAIHIAYKTFSTTNVAPRSILEHTFLTI